MRYALGIDVGGTKIAAALMDESGRTLSCAQRPTPAGGLDALVDAVQAAGEEAFGADGLPGPLQSPVGEDFEFAGVGIGLPAQVERDGTIPHCTNLAFLVGSDVVARLGAAFDGRVHVENDANLAALGEARFGAHPTDSLVMLTLGTGIGGGVIASGRMLRGPHGGAGELGHIVLEVDGPLCPCGQRGCAEALIAAPYVARRAAEAMAAAVKGKKASRLWKISGVPQAVTPEDVIAAARAGDDLARAVMHRTGEYLGVLLASLANIFAPTRIAIGGGFGEAAMNLLLPVAIQRLELGAEEGSILGLSVEAASLGPSAGTVGAAAFALEEGLA
jgi:glucokinase